LAWQKLNSRFEAYYSSIDESSKSGEVLSTGRYKGCKIAHFYLLILTALFTALSEIMFNKVALSTLICGLRVQDAGPLPFLRFRSSNAFIVTTVVIAVFTVGVPFVVH
jgi:hypothetical protein